MAKNKKPVKSKKIVKKKSMKKAVAVKKKKKVLAIPKGYNSITPYLIISHDASRAVDFYKKAFDAKETTRMERHDGKIAHAELKIGDSKIMLADECREMNARGPKSCGGSPVCIHLYVKAVDDVVSKAVKLGATVLKPVEDMFYGDRSGMLQDPYGHNWTVSTHVEDVTPAQTRKRAEALFRAEGAMA